MSPTFKSFSSDHEKNTLILNKYLDILSSDLPSCLTRFYWHKELSHSFLLKKKKFTSIYNKTYDSESVITIVQKGSGFYIVVNIYDGSDANRIFSFSMSIYPFSVRNIEDIENYPRYKMLKKFIKSKDNIIDNILEGMRIFHIESPYGRSARIVSTKICYSSYNISYLNRLNIYFPLFSLEKNHPISIDGAFKSYITADELKTIKNKFDRDEILVKNCNKKIPLNNSLLTNI